MEDYVDIQNQTRDLEEMRNEVLLAKFDLVYENMMTEQLEALLEAEKENQHYLEQRGPFIAECKNLMTETDKSLHKFYMMMISGFTQDVHCAVQEIHRHRQKISDEREAEHKKRLADLERELMKQPHVQVIKVRRDKIDQLENEFLELERQIAFEQAEILRITELEKEVVASYEPNIRDLETDVSRDEAEEAQIKVQLGHVAASIGETIAVQQPIAEQQPSTQVATQQSGTPPHLKKLEIDEIQPESSGTEDSTTYPGQRLAIALAIADQSGLGECSGSQAATCSQNVSNESKNSDLAPHQLVKQMDHSHADSVRSEGLERSDEPNLVAAGNDNVFAIPMAPAPHANKRKESTPEQASPAKKPHYEHRSFESRESRKSPRELLRESPRQSPRQSPLKEIGSIEYRRRIPNDFEPLLNLVKREYQSEQKSVIAKPVVEAPMGATPREVVSQLYSQHRDNERSGHSKYPSAFQPIETQGHLKTADNRDGSSLSTSGQHGSKTPAKLSSAQAKTATSAEEKSKMNKQGGNEKCGKTLFDEQQVAFRSAQHDDDRSHYSRSTSATHSDSDDDDNPFGFYNDSSFNFEPTAPTNGQGGENKSDDKDEESFFGDTKGQHGEKESFFDNDTSSFELSFNMDEAGNDAEAENLLKFDGFGSAGFGD